MSNIAIVYHCAFQMNGVRPRALIEEQMRTLRASKLLDSAQRFCVGVNGGTESEADARACFNGAELQMHGLGCRSENMTLIALQQWAKQNPGWFVLYFHAKGSSHPKTYGLYARDTAWRHCMERHVVKNWQRCVADLERGCESVGSHWFQHLDPRVWYWAGNFWWATSDFLATLPPLENGFACKKFGPADVRARYEAEIFIGTGPRLPKRVDYHPGFDFNCRG